jgi:competence protein ComEC
MRDMMSKIYPNTLPNRYMLPKINISNTVYLRLRNRAIKLWARYPMVAILAISLLAISMQESFGNAWCALLFFGILTSGVATLWHWKFRPTRHSAWAVLSIALAIGLVISYFHSLGQQDSRERLANWESTLMEITGKEELGTAPWNPIACRGTVDSSLRYRKATIPGGNTDLGEVGWQTLTVLRVFEIRIGGQWSPASLLIPLTINGKLSGYYPGDAIELYGQWRLPSKPSNPGQFNQSRRYAEQGYSAQARADSESQLARIDRTSRLRVDRYLAMVSAKALWAIERYVILGQSELTAALVLGQREQAEWRLQEELLATGTIHMLSISGMHIEMVALTLWLIGTFFQLPRKPMLLGICLIVIGYALLCGANPPVARATMMLAGLCLAKWNGWRFSSANILAFAGFALILHRTSVVFETGTQLSFMAVAVLILSHRSGAPRVSPLARLIESKSSRWSKNLRRIGTWSREMIRTSFWVWFVTAPLVWSSFHVVSPIAIALNLLLWLPMLFALMAGLGLIAFGWFPVFAWPLGLVCGVSLWMVQWIVGLGEQIPLGHFWLRAPPAWWLHSFYALGIITSILGGVKRSTSRRLLVRVLGIWFVFGLTIQPTMDFYRSAMTGRDPKLSLTFIDVGHGTNILIETPDQQAWLYDAGRLGDHQRSYQVMVEALWALNKPRIDGVILSHADSDHYNGLEGIAKRFAIEKLISTRQVFEHRSPLLTQNLHVVGSRGARMVAWKKGDVHQGEGWSMLALHPPDQGVVGTDNANSLCVMMEFAGRRILLPGDLEPPGMQMLVAQDATKVDVMMAPHHGSLSAKSEALLDWCAPEIIVISGANRAQSTRVLDAFAAKHRQVLVTARDHAIRIEIARDGSIDTKHWVVDHWETL